MVNVFRWLGFPSLCRNNAESGWKGFFSSSEHQGWWRGQRNQELKSLVVANILMKSKITCDKDWIMKQSVHKKGILPFSKILSYIWRREYPAENLELLDPDLWHNAQLGRSRGFISQGSPGNFRRKKALFRSVCIVKQTGLQISIPRGSAESSKKRPKNLVFKHLPSLFSRLCDFYASW